jgi:deoxyadenosine/deoxycytidine kinase
MNHRFIAIEGNIGAGKTTLSQLLSQHYNAKLVLEEFAENPFLTKFYENPKQYAFPLELFFLAERFKQQQELVKNKDLFQEVIVSDYIFIKCLLFAKVNLPEEEFRLYQKMFDVFYQQLTPPDIIIYLHAPVNRLQSNIKKRNRKFEQTIPDEYLFKIQETYTSYIKQHNVKTIFVDASNSDFLYNEAHFKVITDALEKDLEEGQHYFNLP